MSRILFITTSQPSINPRMRKAADALAECGHSIHILYSWRSDWASRTDKEIFLRSLWTHQQIGGDPTHDRLLFFLSKVMRKLSELLGNLEGSHCRAVNNFIKAGITWNPDLVIGHNPGAIYPTIKIASILDIPSLMDAEDFYRGETNDPRIQSQMTQLEDRWITKFSTVTTAAPLISKQYETLYPKQNFITVNNAFPAKYGAVQVKPVKGPLRVVWFSQIVGPDRGLEQFLDALRLIPKTPCTLTLIGLCTEIMADRLRSQLESELHTLTILPPMEEGLLFEFLSTQEIGLALELGETENRRLCRTNKLYTYPLAGCHTLASQTPSQLHFFEQFPELGTTINLSQPDEVSATLAGLYEERDCTFNLRKTALAQAKQSLNWESESAVLTSLVQEIHMT